MFFQRQNWESYSFTRVWVTLTMDSFLNMSIPHLISFSMKGNVSVWVSRGDVTSSIYAEWIRKLDRASTSCFQGWADCLNLWVGISTAKTKHGSFFFFSFFFLDCSIWVEIFGKRDTISCTIKSELKQKQKLLKTFLWVMQWTAKEQPCREDVFMLKRLRVGVPAVCWGSGNTAQTVHPWSPRLCPVFEEPTREQQLE